MEHCKTYNLIIGSTGVVTPRPPLHSLLSYGLEVHQVVALRYKWFVFDTLLSVCLLGVFLFLHLGDRTQVDGAQVFRLVKVLIEGIWGVNRIESLCRIFALHILRISSRMLHTN